MAKSVIAVSNSGAQVSKVVVGKPVKRVMPGAFDINSLGGIDTSAKTTGSLLIYDPDTDMWVASNTLEDQNINGGTY